MGIEDTLRQAREYMSSHGIGGWLVYDYRGMNPVLQDTLGSLANVTRPCWVWVPADGEARILAGFVDQGRFGHIGLPTSLFVNRQDMLARLKSMIGGAGKVAMEYSPGGALPRVSRVDGGTLETVRDLGVDVVSSADLVQFATQCWSPEQLDSHRWAAGLLDRIVQDAFACAGERVGTGFTEYDLAEFIRSRYHDEGLEAADGPVVAVNRHSSDPHFDPGPETTVPIERGDWLLIDLWARARDDDAVYADITWTAFVGDKPSSRHRQVFDVVTGARDAALAQLQRAFERGESLQGWQIDSTARDLISQAGFGSYFGHRLGHSLGREVHGNAVNLDGWETFDTRAVIPGIAVTIEPGIYLPEFGVRSEIDLYISESGPEVTTKVQREIVLI